MTTITKKATPEHEDAYQIVMAGLKQATDKYPDIKNIDVIAMLSRAVGYCIAACYPDERDLARLNAIENMDRGTADVAQQMPTRPGVLQDQPAALKDPDPVDRSQRVLSGGGAVTDDHREINSATGQQKGYVVLTAAERAKGFVRPVRRSYIHKTCGTQTTMSQDIAETYARDPKFYSGTFCVGCRNHFPLVQFFWCDNPDQQVGS